MPERDRVGPILFLRGYEADEVQLAALVIARTGATPGELVTARERVAPETIGGRCGYEVLRYRFALAAEAGAWYELEGTRYQVNADCRGDLRVAYVSCNGQEHGDLDRSADLRNAMWLRLADRQQEAPLNLLLHGGDQLYADEVTRAHPLSRDWPEDVPESLPRPSREELGEALREAFFLRYLEQFSQPGIDRLTARVPSLAMWDDHDICDGWGSLPTTKLDSDVGRILFAAARENFLLFQFGVGADEVPPICLDETGRSLTWAVTLPGVHLVAPDLRSERRPDRILGERGWTALRRALAAVDGGRLLLMSSVPVLGPRLALVESAMQLTPWMERYEDDLRDQWQSRAHREEWSVLLRELVALQERAGVEVTILSGEIHLAVRGTMATARGALHQLVASGIVHPPPPRSYAHALGTLARLGEAPLTGHPIRLRPLPGRRGIYTAARNYLVLARRGDAWSAAWELEEAGTTPDLTL